jgi:ATP-dependent exoDNAse (exonuclease V) beta subunit
VKVKSKKGDIDSHLEDLNYLYGEFRDNLGKEMYNRFVISYEEKLLKIIEKIYSIYDEIKFREKRFTHTDISIYTFKYLEEKELGFIDENGLTEEFFEIIDGRLRSVFIDEFQDTSILQWRILKNILDKSEDVICVGDEKQSIYGWRGGEKKLFENLAKIIDGKEEELDRCFRSKRNIVEYTNEIFEELSSESRDLYSIFNEWKFNCVGFKDNSDGGAVKLITNEEEKDTVELMIDEIEREFSSNYNGIGILARTKKTLEKIAVALGERGIPYTLESDTTILESRGIGGVYSLISWLVKRDFLALLDFLRSDLMNISALSLKEIVERRAEVESYLYSNEENEVSLEIESEIMKRLRGFYHDYKFYNGETEFLTYEILQGVGIGSRFQNDEESINIFGLYKLLKEYRYFNDFLIEYEENSQKEKFKKIFGGNSNSVSLMTIHKSKGLEFDTLFYYIPTKQRNRGDRGMEFYLEMDETYSQVHSFLITDNKFNKILESINGINYLKERELKREHEEINNLYVALTRPKNNIFVVVENREDLEKSNFSTLLKDRDRGDIILSKGVEKNIETGEEYEITLTTPDRLHKEEVDKNRQEGLNKIYSHTLQIEGKRVRGIVVHYFLENILNWEESEIELAKRLTFAKYSSLLGEREIKELFSPQNIEYIYRKCKEIFQTDWDYVYREYPVYLKVDGERKDYRIDRLMIKLPKENKKGIIYIADYKTGKYDEEQIRNYTLAVAERVKKNSVNIDEFEIKTEYIELDI